VQKWPYASLVFAIKGTFDARARWCKAASDNGIRVDRSQVWPIGASLARNKRLKTSGAGGVEDMITQGEGNNQQQRRETTTQKGV
jgi:hypothetical protein